jgi:hypothetical protein
MILCKLRHLEQRCRERGYTLDQARPCIVRQDGDRIMVDETHPAYPSRRQGLPEPEISQSTAPMKPPGPGSELKSMLQMLGIRASDHCSCNSRAKYMDDMGVDWCRENIELICGWLKEEAERRSLPFSMLAAKILVRRAISAAEKAARTMPPGGRGQT